VPREAAAKSGVERKPPVSRASERGAVVLEFQSTAVLSETLVFLWDAEVLDLLKALHQAPEHAEARS